MSNNDLNTVTYADLKAEEENLLARLMRVQAATKAMENLYGNPSRLEYINEAIVTTQEGAKHTFVGVSTHDALVTLLQEYNRPLKTKEILEQFHIRGKVITAQAPMVSLYNGLVGACERQNSKIINMGGGEWGLKGRDERDATSLI